MSDAKEVFICYSHLDRCTAQNLADILQGYGFTVWWDHALLGGDNFRKLITEQIHDAKVVLALFSTRSVQSGWVIDEAGRAHQSAKLVPILIDEVEVPLGFGQLHHCNLVHWNYQRDGEAIEEILVAVERYARHPRCNFRFQVQSESAAAPRTGEPAPRDRFRVGWLPDKGVRSVMRTVLPVYALALLVAAVMAASPRAAVHQWVRLLHVYSGMIVLGGGLFLFIVFRFGDRAPTSEERAAVADAARPLFGGWRIAALAQLITGFILIGLRGAPLSGWVIQGVLFYLFAVYFWLAGFGHALSAARHDALYQTGPQIVEYRRMRNRHLVVAVVLTAWVLITMIYRDDADLSRLLARPLGW